MDIYRAQRALNKRRIQFVKSQLETINPDNRLDVITSIYYAASGITSNYPHFIDDDDQDGYAFAPSTHPTRRGYIQSKIPAFPGDLCVGRLLQDVHGIDVIRHLADDYGAEFGYTLVRFLAESPVEKKIIDDYLKYGMHKEDFVSMFPHNGHYGEITQLCEHGECYRVRLDPEARQFLGSDDRVKMVAARSKFTLLDTEDDGMLVLETHHEDCNLNVFPHNEDQWDSVESE